MSRALADLRSQLGMGGSASTAQRQSKRIRIILNPSEVSSLGEEGFHLHVDDRGVALSAAAWRGINYGILDLVRRLAESSDGRHIPNRLDILERPSFGLRGIYAHNAWVYNYPYALRTWHLRDWEHYVDLLAYMRVNLLQIWTPISIMSIPLTAQDKAYLAMFKDVVSYAMRERGFRAVWVGDAANNVGLPSNVPIPTRQYYVVHSLRNPAVPAEMRDIIDSRKALYEAIPNAGGYWVIDSDPGGWPGSPSSEFFKILKANRELLDQFTLAKRNVRLIYWIWNGWGNQPMAQNVAAVLHDWQVGERGRPLNVLVCHPDDFPEALRFGLIPRAVWFPYGAIEGEPSSPYTAIRFQEIRSSFQQVKPYGRILGVMGNAQTPLVQIPNISFYEDTAWNLAYADRPEQEILENTARDIYPSIAKEIARGWWLISQTDATAARRTAMIIERRVAMNQQGAPGALGRYITPGSNWFLNNLVAQLRVHADAVDLATRLNPALSHHEVWALVYRYSESASAMINLTGFRAAVNKQGKNLLPFFNWFYDNVDWARIRSSWASFKKMRPGEAKQIYAQLLQGCETKRDTRLCSEMAEFLVGEPPHRSPAFKYAN